MILVWVNMTAVLGEIVNFEEEINFLYIDKLRKYSTQHIKTTQYKTKDFS